MIMMKRMTMIATRGVVGASSTALFASGFVHALEMVSQPQSIILILDVYTKPNVQKLSFDFDILCGFLSH